MNKLIVLGTGNAMVTKCYNTCFAIFNGNEYFLIDGGGGNNILSILENKNIDIAQIRNIFVTHSHTDHILGIIWILRKISQMILQEEYTKNVNIYCHSELIEKIKTICNLTFQHKFTDLFDKRIIFKEVKNDEKQIIMNKQVTFFDIYSTKEKQFGFSINLEDNEKLTCLGDEPLNDLCKKYVENATWLLCEAFCMYKDKEKYEPYKKNHSTVKDAAEIAQQLNVKNLVLWHTEDNYMINIKFNYTNEAKQYYSGNIFVPNDLEEIKL